MSAVREDYGSDYGLTDLVVTRQWGPWRLVSAIGAVRHSLTERYEWNRAAPTPLVFEQASRTTFLSLESRLSRAGADGAGWLIGTSLIRNRSEQARGLGPPGAPLPLADVTNEIAEGAVFGEAGFRLAPRLTATAGARVAHSRIAASSEEHGPIPLSSIVDGGASADRSDTAFLPSASLAWQAAPDLFLFARYQQAFRPGGVALAGEAVRRFRPDRVAAFEAGGRYGGGAIDLAASFALTRWRDIQSDVIDFVGNPTTANIGDGRILTLDLRLGWRPVEGLEIDAGAVFNHSRVVNPVFNIDMAPEAPLPNVAHVNARFGAAWRRERTALGDLRLSAAARYVGKSRLGVGGVLGQEQGDWLDLSLAARAERGRHAFSLSLTNLLDATGNRFALGSPYTISEQEHVTPLRPRTLRAGWELRF
jgi:outer membrane receptor protein involved in Fe transport